MIFPPPSSLHQFQILQWKVNFLRCFVLNYVALAEGFTLFLKKWIPFIWDEFSKKTFDALKNSLISAPLLHPPNYHHDYFLYLATTDSTISTIPIQDDDDDGDKHMIYYVSWNMFDVESWYAHVQKLALASIQHFQHYIVLQKTIVISNCNPMIYFWLVSCWGGKYSEWIIILQEFDLEFVKAKSKKSVVSAELICDLPSATTSTATHELNPYENLFFISIVDPWYGVIINYLQTQNFWPELSNS